MQLLLDHGADVNAKDHYGSTPLHHSSFRNEGLREDEDYPVRMKGSVEGARLLLEHGANIDAEDNKGDTPFLVALEAGHHEMVEFLWGLGSML
jgi:ankyrin repeat protein